MSHCVIVMSHDSYVTAALSHTSLPSFFLPTSLSSSGGRQCKRSLKTFEVFDMESRVWSVLPVLPCKRSYSGVLWDTAGRLCWLGGLRQGGMHQRSKFTNNVNIYNPSEGEHQCFQ